jgi:DME family drug/metabolite transporter
MAWLALVTLSLAYVAFGWGLRTLAPTTVVMLTLLEPAVAAVLAVTFLDETMSGAAWVGAVLVVAAMPLVALSARTTVRT